MKKRTFYVSVTLPNNDVAHVEYVSEMLFDDHYMNKITQCMFHEVDIAPCFSVRERVERSDVLTGIKKAVDKNAPSRWEALADTAFTEEETQLPAGVQLVNKMFSHFE